MGFTTVPDKATGDVFTEAMWDTYIKDNLNTGVPVLLASSTLAASAASIDLTGISQSWANLMLLAYLRSDAAATGVTAHVRFNGDSGANYDQQYFFGRANTANAGEAFGATSAQIGNCPAASVSASFFAAIAAEIPDYSQTSGNKALSSAWAHKIGTGTTHLEAGQLAGFWRSSAAINQITVFAGTGNLVAGSRVSLYGMP